MSTKEILRRHPNLERAARRLLSLAPSRLRSGRAFWQWYSFYDESEHWSWEELTAYQMERLRALLSELRRTSAFYRRRLCDVDVAAIRSLKDFQARVPELTRQEFADNFDEIQAVPMRREKLIRTSTSGTTGMALQFSHPAKDQEREFAAICHQWKRVGYEPGVSRRAEFRGLTSNGRRVDEFPEFNMIRCSILNLKKQHVGHYAEQIRKNRIVFYHGCPSALVLLANEIIRDGIDFPQPHAVLLGSEMVFDWQVAMIQEAFPEARVFAHYGCAERTALAGGCEHRREYHVLPQYAVVEIDPASMEIIGTNLFNAVNGFVRYRMTDRVSGVDSDPCPDCGRAYSPRLKALAGRSEDYLYSHEKGWIPPAAFTFPLKPLKAIQELQILQKERRKITIRYSIRPEASKGRIALELKNLESAMYPIIGNGMNITFERVSDFPRDASGKFKWIVSEVARESGVFVGRSEMGSKDKQGRGEKAESFAVSFRPGGR